MLANAFCIPIRLGQLRKFDVMTCYLKQLITVASDCGENFRAMISREATNQASIILGRRMDRLLWVMVNGVFLWFLLYNLQGCETFE